MRSCPTWAVCVFKLVGLIGLLIKPEKTYQLYSCGTLRGLETSVKRIYVTKSQTLGIELQTSF
jgi:hypothetical protein